MSPTARNGRRRSGPPGPGLFDPAEFELRPTGEARLRRMARRPAMPLSRLQARADEDRKTMDRLRDQGRELAREFGLRWSALDAERDGVTEHYGICYEDGEIRIRLRHATTGVLLKESSLVDTLCHELAHLRHLNHGLRFRRLYQRILDRARELGFYDPGRAEPRAIQRSLFSDVHCGALRPSNQRTPKKRTKA